MKEKIRQRALEIGFDDCRFTSAQPPQSAEQFQKWLSEKKFGEMQWIERNAPKRIEPQRILPGAKSAICLATSYHSENARSTLGDSRKGIVARYAQFADYHDILGEKNPIAKFAAD